DWSLLTGVMQSNPFGQDHETLTSVVVPLNTTSTATYGASSSVTSYAIDIGNETASYLLTAAHSCTNADGELPTCLSSGDIHLTTDADLPVAVAVSGNYVYDMPTSPMGVNFSFHVRDLTTGQFLIVHQEQSNTIFGPHAGALSISDSAIMP